MTPSIRASGPSYLKPAPPPLTRQQIKPTALPPLVLIRTVADRQLVIAASEEARSAGIRPGMTLAEAKALCSKLHHADHDPAKDEKSLEALARWMIRFTPLVAIREGAPPTDDQESHGDYLFLDLTGCHRLFGSIDNIITQIASALERMQLTFALGCGPTPGSAYATALPDAARLHLQISNLKSEISDLLSPLPVGGLRINSQTRAALHHLGIATIGQLMSLPRASLPSRFGQQLLLRLDQALGNIPEPLVPLPHFIPIEASMEFEGAVESLEVMWIALRQLLRDITTELAKRGSGARELHAVFRRPYADPIEKTVKLSRASRNVKELFELLRCALEQVETDVGFIGIALHVLRSERIREAQFSLVAHEEEQGQLELDRLVERLIARMGEEGLRQIKLLESYLPECSFSFRGMGVSPMQSDRMGETPMPRETSPRPRQRLDPV
ncbi:MAG TPA: DNA polymerase Y family protein, partial [Tepidisphaeraceae bacterium]